MWMCKYSDLKKTFSVFPLTHWDLRQSSLPVLFCFIMRLHVHMPMCLYTCASLCLYMYVYIHMWKSEVDSICLPRSLPYFFRKCFSLNLELPNWARLSKSHPNSAPPVLVLQMCATTPTFYIGTNDLNSGLCSHHFVHWAVIPPSFQSFW